MCDLICFHGLDPYNRDGCHNRNGSLAKIQILILCFRMYELAIFREGEWRYHARYTGSCNLKPIKKDFYCADISPAHKTQDNEEMYILPLLLLRKST